MFTIIKKIFVLFIIMQILYTNNLQAQANCTAARGAICSESGIYTCPIKSLGSPSIPLALDLVADFGAVPDDGNSDQSAFVCAANFINARAAANAANGYDANVTLYIPGGIYYVGQQYNDVTNTTNNMYGATSVFSLLNCSNVTIYGDGASTIIKHKSGLHYGFFDTDGESKYPMPEENDDDEPFVPPGASAGVIGSIFYLEKCNNIEIKNMQIDGNTAGYILGAQPKSGLQLEDNAFFVFSSFDIRFYDLDIHDMGLDGIYLAPVTTPTQPNIAHTIVLEDIKVEDCGRNAVTLAGGDDFKFTNCQLIQSDNCRFRSAPASCIDLEAESIDPVTNTVGCVPNNNGIFTNCTFSNTTNTDAYYAINNYAGNATNMLFTNCKVIQQHASYNNVNNPAYTFFIRTTTSNNWTFTGCEFYGCSITGGGTPGSPVKFNDCLFQNCYEGELANQGPCLLTITNESTEVNNCTFNSFYNVNALDVGGGDCSTGEAIIKNSIINSFKSVNYPDIIVPSVHGRGIFSKFNINYCVYPQWWAPDPVTCTTGAGAGIGEDLIFEDPAHVNDANVHIFTNMPDFVLPDCSISTCVSDRVINYPVYAPNMVYKASNTVTASKKVDLSKTSSEAPGYIRYTAGHANSSNADITDGYVDLTPGFETLLSPTSFFEAYIRPCSDVTAFGRPANTKKTNSVSTQVKNNIEVLKNDKFNITCNPNPFKGNVTIAVLSTKNSAITAALYNMQGAKVKQVFTRKALSKGSAAYTVNLSSVPAGIYFLHIQVDGEKDVVKKLIKL